MNLKKILRRVPVAWRWAFGAFLIGGITVHFWAWVVFKIYPLSVLNTVLYEEPTLLLFDLRSSDVYFYDRQLDGNLLRFQSDHNGNLVDLQSNTQWELWTGRALDGSLAGYTLAPSKIDTEKIFPYRGVVPHSSPMLAIWQRFDTNWYLKIAERGYSDDGSTAFFPLYPLLVRFLSFIVGDMVLSSRLISLSALLLALFFFYKVANEYADESVVERSLIYMLAFPSAFFFFASYTESLFLLLVLASFFYARQEKWAIVTVLGILTALTRVVGMLIFIPLFYIWFTQKSKHHWREAVVFFLIPLGVGTYFLPKMFSSLQTKWQAHPVFPWEHFVELYRLMSNNLLSSIDILNMFITIIVGIICLIILWKQPLELGLYSLLMFAPSLFRLNAGQPFVSMFRYVLVIFPMFILLGEWGENAWVNRLILYLSIPFALYLSCQFWIWSWVG